MSATSRDALTHLTAALEAHLDAVISRRSATDAAVDDAFDAVVEAFERYEDVLDAEYGEALPLILDDEVVGSLDDELDDDDLDDDEEDLDDEELDAHAVEDDDDMDDDLDEFDLS